MCHNTNLQVKKHACKCADFHNITTLVLHNAKYALQNMDLYAQTVTLQNALVVQAEYYLPTV